MKKAPQKLLIRALLYVCANIANPVGCRMFALHSARARIKSFCRSFFQKATSPPAGALCFIFPNSLLLGGTGGISVILDCYVTFLLSGWSILFSSFLGLLIKTLGIDFVIFGIKKWFGIRKRKEI